MPVVVAAVKDTASRKASKQSLIKVTKKPPKKRRKSRKQSYSTYEFRGLAQIHPFTRILSKAMIVMNSFIVNIFDHIASEASHLICYNKCHIRPGRSRVPSASCCQGNGPNMPAPEAPKWSPNTPTPFR
ncbi:putative histone H2B type 2-D [Carcharodon carcharias]|uniref:putative histone H2B type 2-D n=1 Tax=Carcharodon carcharias TaxID=13397 RepID=UPI001B7E775F|nr:putative histone H2B type 2-D [Carcharodon carcharias]